MMYRFYTDMMQKVVNASSIAMLALLDFVPLFLSTSGNALCASTQKGREN